MAQSKKKAPKRSTGGSLSGMRSGMKRMAGAGSKGKKKAKGAPPSFMTVFLWSLGIAVLIALVWSIVHR